ncbi:hypothetical protein NPIL_116011 [Nephila pilipes]|uniref:Uncharacterized protein n=1 Tax=Nephila pilipes TaxID=299642 RepID=A0A8X6PRR0_NEPPI|nr:hypothetical protein NPIL_116011 [Nephila pilipes]
MLMLCFTILQLGLSYWLIFRRVEEEMKAIKKPKREPSGYQDEMAGNRDEMKRDVNRHRCMRDVQSSSREHQREIFDGLIDLEAFRHVLPRHPNPIFFLLVTNKKQMQNTNSLMKNGIHNFPNSDEVNLSSGTNRLITISPTINFI